MEISRGDLAIRLVEERSRLGYSQRDFAAKLDISVNGLRNYETGQRGISADFLAQASTLGLDVQYVLTGVSSNNRSEVERTFSQSVKINGGAGNIGVVHGTVHQINTARHVTKINADVKPGVDHIDEKQAARLTALVKDVVEFEEKLKQKPKSFKSVWASLNAHMKVSRYRLIPLEDFAKAEKYLLQWIGRLNSMKTAPVEDGDSWRKRKYAYIKINSKNDQDALAAYLKRNFQASSLTDLSNDQLDQVYRYVASRRSAGRGKR